MEELVDLIATDASPSDVSDKIKDALMAKAAARIDAFKPQVASSVFDAEGQVTDAEYQKDTKSAEI